VKVTAKPPCLNGGEGLRRRPHERCDYRIRGSGNKKKLGGGGGGGRGVDRGGGGLTRGGAGGSLRSGGKVCGGKGEGKNRNQKTA